MTLESLRASQASYRLNEQFLKAESQEQRIHEFKQQQLQAQLSQVAASQAADRQQLQAAAVEELRQFHTRWHSALQALQQQCQEQERQLRASHKEALASQRLKLEEANPVRYKASSVLLDLTRIKEKANKTKQFTEAHRLKKQIAKQRQVELKAYMELRSQKIQNQLLHFERGLERELSNLQAKHERQRHEHESQQSREYEVLIKKYENLHKELELVQKIERNKVSGKHVTGVGVVVTDLVSAPSTAHTSPAKPKKRVK